MVVLAGDVDALDALKKRVGDSVLAVRMRVEVAYHSRHMDKKGTFPLWPMTVLFCLRWTPRLTLSFKGDRDDCILTPFDNTCADFHWIRVAHAKDKKRWTNTPFFPKWGWTPSSRFANLGRYPSNCHHG
mmetsp:Transcript_1850/g.4425  ORF Transcript_1850/g.4425 Transcript_1850/m.4425 type:complete len:129 (-) Transcript_1850:32-418(-)